MAMKATQATSNWGEEGIEAMMKHLGIMKEDLDNVVFEEEGLSVIEAH
jgi:hypothetical protein